MSDEKKRLLQEMEKLFHFINILDKESINTNLFPEFDHALWENMKNYFEDKKNNDELCLSIPESQIPFLLQVLTQLNASIQEQIDEELIQSHNIECHAKTVDDTDSLDDDPSADTLIDGTDDAIPMKHRIMQAIQKLDQQLLPQATPEQTDELLDVRSELLTRLQSYS